MEETLVCRFDCYASKNVELPTHNVAWGKRQEESKVPRGLFCSLARMSAPNYTIDGMKYDLLACQVITLGNLISLYG